MTDKIMVGASGKKPKHRNDRSELFPSKLNNAEIKKKSRAHKAKPNHPWRRHKPLITDNIIPVKKRDGVPDMLGDKHIIIPITK